MLKRSLHILISLVLVLTTTNTLWSHLLDGIDDAVEISSETEKESEKDEKEKELDEWDDDKLSENSHLQTSRVEDVLNNTHISDCAFGGTTSKLYILLHRLKIDC